MNIYTLALLLLAWKMLGSGKSNNTDNASRGVLDTLSGLLDDNTKSLVDSVTKLAGGSSTTEDKLGSLLSIIGNPTTKSILESLTKQPAKQDVNDEGYVFKDKPSNESKEFFRPIDNIADSEVKHKLYWFYDHWYL